MPKPRKPVKLAAEQLFDYAVRRLGAQASSTGDLKAKLRLRAADPADVDATIARLKEIGYLDDRKFAETFAAVRVVNGGFGRMRVLQDLRSRRVAGSLAEKAVEQALEGKSEADQIEAFIERRMPSIRDGRIDDDKKLAAAFRKLRRAGFATGAILQALKRRAAAPEKIEEFPEEESDESEARADPEI